MASHRRPKPVGRTRASILTAAAATAVAISSQAGAAHADPAPTLDQVKTQVDQLHQQAEAATEQYDASKEKQDELQKQVTELQDSVARQQAQVSTVQSRLAEVAAQQYRDGGISSTVQLMLSSDPGSFLTKAGAASQMSATQADTLKSFKAEQAKLDGEKAEAQQKLAQLDQVTHGLQAQKDEVLGKLRQATDLLNSLTQKQRDEMAAAQAKADQAASAAATASRDGGRPTLNPGTPSGSYAAQALAYAEGKIGATYVYGAAGPTTFDCSGLVQWAFRQAGVSLPRTAEEQWHAGTSIGTNVANARPGDLVVYEGGGHIAIYVGGGQVIHAPHTGTVVKYASATMMPITAIVRI